MPNLTNDYGSVVLLAAHASELETTQTAMTTQDIIKEFKSAIEHYLQAPVTGQSEEMLLDELIINKAKILTSLANYVDSENKNQLFSSESPVTMAKDKINQMKNVNGHKAALVLAYLSGQMPSSSTPEAQQNEAISTALPQQ